MNDDLTIGNDSISSTSTITITGASDLETGWVSIGDISTTTIPIDINSMISNDDITFDLDDIKITPTLWTETLPDVDTLSAMCNEYPALAKAYENFQTVYKLVEQDYKGKQEDD
jgi:hypothetical protein